MALSIQTDYQPFEKELTVEGLTNCLNELKAKNQAVIQATGSLNAARVDRNKVLYGANDGMTVIGNRVKAYLKSLYGSSSPEMTC